MPPDRWLILADDLTGAADTAIAFARRGWRASVEWGAQAPDDEVLALDAETRSEADPAAAAAQHVSLIRAYRRGRTRFFKKIDSTLRGHPAAELEASLRALGPGTVALVAPAFPTQGRTTLDGRVQLHGLPLEASPLWAREHSYVRADLREIFGRDGQAVRHACLDALHDGHLPELIQAALAEGRGTVVCDALEERDLSLIAHAALPFAERLLWVGSAGLAHAIAGVTPRRGDPPAPPAVAGGILMVVGSMAEASQAGATRLAEEGDLRTALVSTAMLRGGPDAWKATRRSVQETLSRGQDVMVTIAGQDGIDPTLVRDFGALLLDARLGGLIATGGGTARALLEGQGATSLTMVDEVEPGVPLGLAGHLPVITKAGAFGDAGTLGRCLTYLRRLRATETSA
nr:four-carbon acid sugar kinase family protein [uncultured Roseococcus sp.]